MRRNDDRIGRTGHYRTDSLAWEVEVTGVESVRGEERYEIRPTAGEGHKWVPSTRVSLPPSDDDEEASDEAF